MAKRLRVFRFHQKLVKPDRTLPACGRCFAAFLLQPAALCDSLLGGAGRNVDEAPTSSKRPAEGHTGNTPAGKRCSESRSWTIDEAITFVRDLGLGQLEISFRSNAVDGRLLAELSEAELVSELGMTKLQAKKLASRLPQLQIPQFHCSL